MITCDRCKTENLDGSQYCDECGAPLRPNGRPSPVQKMLGHESNGNHAPAPHPEFAGGRASAGLSFSALRTTAKPHARLVIEKGRSTGKPCTFALGFSYGTRVMDPELANAIRVGMGPAWHAAQAPERLAIVAPT